ncbi:unnamed protein product [Chrysoparadoxa australica]
MTRPPLLRDERRVTPRDEEIRRTRPLKAKPSLSDRAPLPMEEQCTYEYMAAAGVVAVMAATLWDQRGWRDLWVISLAICIAAVKGGLLSLLGRRKFVFRVEKSLDRAASVGTMWISLLGEVAVKNIKVVAAIDHLRKPGNMAHGIDIDSLHELDDLVMTVQWIYLRFTPLSMLPTSPVKKFQIVRIRGFQVNLHNCVEQGSAQGRKRSSTQADSEEESEIEQMVQQSMRAVLGADFVQHYEDYVEELTVLLRKASQCVVDLVKRYSIECLEFEDFCVHLNRVVWQDLLSSVLDAEHLARLEDIDFVFDMAVPQKDLVGEDGKTAFELGMSLTKRLMLKLSAAIVKESRRSLFNSKNVASVVVSTLVPGHSMQRDTSARFTSPLAAAIEKEIRETTQAGSIAEFISVLRQTLFVAVIAKSGGKETEHPRHQDEKNHVLAREISLLIRNKDLPESLRVLREVNISEFLSRLTGQTEFGGLLQEYNVDQEHLVQSTEGLTGEDLLKDGLGKLGLTIDDLACPDKSEHLQEIAHRFHLDMLDVGKLSNELQEALEDIQSGEADFSAVVADLGGKVASSFGTALREEDMAVLSGLLILFDTIRTRKKLDHMGKGTAAKGTGWHTMTLDLKREIRALQDDPRVSSYTKEALSKTLDLVKGDISVDTYLALGMIEWAIGGVLVNLPSLLPARSQKVEKRGYTVQVSGIDLQGFKFPRDEIHLSLLGTTLPARGAFVITRFGLGRVLRYKKSTRCLIVELLHWPLLRGGGGAKYAKGYLQPGTVEQIDRDEWGVLNDTYPSGGLVDEVEVAPLPVLPKRGSRRASSIGPASSSMKCSTSQDSRDGLEGSPTLRPRSPSVGDSSRSLVRQRSSFLRIPRRSSRDDSPVKKSSSFSRRRRASCDSSPESAERRSSFLNTRRRSRGSSRGSSRERGSRRGSRDCSSDDDSDGGGYSRGIHTLSKSRSLSPASPRTRSRQNKGSKASALFPQASTSPGKEASPDATLDSASVEARKSLSSSATPDKNKATASGPCLELGQSKGQHSNGSALASPETSPLSPSSPRGPVAFPLDGSTAGSTAGSRSSFGAKKIKSRLSLRRGKKMPPVTPPDAGPAPQAPQSPGPVDNLASSWGSFKGSNLASPNSRQGPSGFAADLNLTGGSKAKKRLGSSGKPKRGLDEEASEHGFASLVLRNIEGTLSNVKWSFQQHGFPYLEDAGILNAAISGLHVAVELDPVWLKASALAQHTPTKAKKWTWRSSKDESPNAVEALIAEEALFGFEPVSLKISKCECVVGEVRVEFAESRRDALYNAVAGLFSDALRQAIADMVVDSLEEELGKMLQSMNERIAVSWQKLIEKTQSEATRLTCEVLGGTDIKGAAGRSSGKTLRVKLSVLHCDHAFTSRVTRECKYKHQLNLKLQWGDSLVFVVPESLEFRDIQVVAEVRDSSWTLVGRTAPRPLTLLQEELEHAGDACGAVMQNWALDSGGSLSIRCRLTHGAASQSQPIASDAEARSGVTSQRAATELG